MLRADLNEGGPVNRAARSAMRGQVLRAVGGALRTRECLFSKGLGGLFCTAQATRQRRGPRVTDGYMWPPC